MHNLLNVEHENINARVENQNVRNHPLAITMISDVQSIGASHFISQYTIYTTKNIQFDTIWYQEYKNPDNSKQFF